MTYLNNKYEIIADSIEEMDRNEVKREIMHFEGPLKLDFTEDFLDKQPMERLRHILLAAKIQYSSN